MLETWTGQLLSNAAAGLCLLCDS